MNPSASTLALLALLFAPASSAQQVAPVGNAPLTDSTRLREVLELHRRAGRDPAARRAYVQAVVNPEVILPGLGYYTDAKMWLVEDSVAAVRNRDARGLTQIFHALYLVDDKVTAAAVMTDYTKRLEAARQSKDTSLPSLEDRVYRLNVTLWQGMGPLSQRNEVVTRASEAESRRSAARERSMEALKRQAAAEERAAKKVSTYEGQKLNNRPEGRGVLVYSNGDRYEGEFHLGQRHGRGVFELASGVRFEGEFVEGDLGREGTLEVPTGTRYIGEMQVGRRSGQGTLELASGERYTGGFLDDSFEDNGVLEYADGGRYDGGWHRGKREGHGSEEYANGRVLRGRFENDRYVGPDRSTAPIASVPAVGLPDPQPSLRETPVSALSRAPAVSGTVKDAGNGKPVSEASIYLNRTVREEQTAKDGSFKVSAETPVEMIIRRAGYVPLTLNVRGDQSELGELRLRAVGTNPDRDSVKAMDLKLYPQLRTFYDHKARYSRGAFFAPDDLERRAGTIPDLIRQQPGFRDICVPNKRGELDCGKADRGPTTIMGSGRQAMAEERLCTVDVWTDDVGPERSLDEILLREVLAVEAYPNPASAPQGLGGKCASARLWMKRAMR